MNFKFGVLYAKQGQTTDDEVFSNGRVRFHSQSTKVPFASQEIVIHYHQSFVETF